MKYYVAIEKESSSFDLYREIWASDDVHGIRADTMDEGIEKAIEIENARGKELYFISIVADDINYIPQLKTLDNATNAPILVATFKYNEDEHHQVLDNGGDAYAGYRKEMLDNVNGVKMVIQKIEQWARKREQMTETLSYNGMILKPTQRNAVFINDHEVELTRTLFDLLYYLVLNQGVVLSFEKIYDHVYFGSISHDPTTVVKSAVKRIRKRISEVTDADYIQSIRGYGYRIAPRFDKK